METLLTYGEIAASIAVVVLCVAIVSIPTLCRMNWTNRPALPKAHSKMPTLPRSD